MLKVKQQSQLHPQVLVIEEEIQPVVFLREELGDSNTTFQQLKVEPMKFHQYFRMSSLKVCPSTGRQRENKLPRAS